MGQNPDHMRRIATSSSTPVGLLGNYTGRSPHGSSARRWAGAAALFIGLSGASPAVSQEPVPPTIDSLVARLERAEETIALLQQQMADQAQVAVQTRSRLSFELTGRVLVHAFSNSARVNNIDVPLMVSPLVADGLPRGGIGLSVRQSSLGFIVTAPNILGADFTGDMDLDFYGGQNDGSTSPIIRLAVTRAWLRWKRAEVMIGQDGPLVSPLNPRSLASIGAPGFSATGNLWAWLPQMRVGVERPGRVTVGVTGAVLAPTLAGKADMSPSDHDLAQRSKRPFVEARAHARWGEDDLAAEVGVGVHRGWYATANTSTLRRAAGVTADASVPLSGRVELRGEWYAGKGMQGLGGGAVGHLFAVTGQPVRSTGMWGQVNVKPTAHVTFGGGVGQDDPDNEGLPATGRRKNEVSEVHVHLRPAGPVVLGFEVRRMATTYETGTRKNTHLNVAVGFEF